MRSRWLDIGQVLFRIFIEWDEVEVNENAKKNEANIQPSYTKQAWSIKELLYGGTDTGNPKSARWAHLARSGSQ